METSHGATQPWRPCRQMQEYQVELTERLAGVTFLSRASSGYSMVSHTHVFLATLVYGGNIRQGSDV